MSSKIFCVENLRGTPIINLFIFLLSYIFLQAHSPLTACFSCHLSHEGLIELNLFFIHSITLFLLLLLPPVGPRKGFRGLFNRAKKLFGGLSYSTTKGLPFSPVPSIIAIELREIDGQTP